MCVQMFILCREVRRIPIIVKGLGAAAAIYTGETSYMDLGNSTGDMVAVKA